MRPQTGVFQAADLIFRLESTIHPPKRAVTRIDTHSEARRHIRELRNYEEKCKEIRGKLKGLEGLERPSNEISLFEDSMKREKRQLRPITPTFRGSVTRTRDSPRSPVSPIRLRTPRVTREGLYHRIVAACKDIPPAKSLEVSIDKERLAASVELKRWNKAFDRFNRLKDLEADLLLPLYLLEKGTEVFNESEVINTARIRRVTASPVQKFLKKGLRK